MTRRRLALTLATLTLLLPIAAHAKHPKAPPQPTISSDQTLTPEDREHLLNDTFTVVKAVREIPTPVQDILFRYGAMALDGMADPGKQWQAGDIVGVKPLPFRRLILAANSAGYSLIYDEHGGIAHYEQASLYRLTQGKATLVWQAMVDSAPRFLSFDQLRAAIRAGKYRSLSWKYRPLQ